MPLAHNPAIPNHLLPPLKLLLKKTTAAGSACRSMGEGHKVNGKGQNDIYMCKVDVALNSAEAKSALDPSIAFTTAAHPVRL